MITIAEKPTTRALPELAKQNNSDGMTRSLQAQLYATLARRERTENKREKTRLALRATALRKLLVLQAKADHWHKLLGGEARKA